MYLSVYISIYVSIHLYIYLPIYLPCYLSIYLNLQVDGTELSAEWAFSSLQKFGQVLKSVFCHLSLTLTILWFCYWLYMKMT